MPATPRKPVIIDCDPGHDDAMAILLALRHFDVLGITTVAGNVDVERTTLNARRIVDLAGRDVLRPNANVAVSLDRPAFLGLIEAALASYP